MRLNKSGFFDVHQPEIRLFLDRPFSKETHEDCYESLCFVYKEWESIETSGSLGLKSAASKNQSMDLED